MKIIDPAVIVDPFDAFAIKKDLERAIRTCYQSKPTHEGGTRKLIEHVLESGHHSTIEHRSITVRIICDRGVTHEIVRHRLAAYSQESTRFCNYSQERFGRDLTFIRPLFWIDHDSTEQAALWEQSMLLAESTYLKMIELGASPQQARSVLPNSLKTELVMTANLREWRHIFKLRCSPKAHPQMIQVMSPLKHFLQEAGLNMFFYDIPAAASSYPAKVSWFC